MPRKLDPLPPEEAAAVRLALAQVAGSEAFRYAPQLTSFLTFIVEKTLAGEAHEIKGYTIATQALGRGADFDPQADPIVRVEAGRLRRALESCYQGGEGRSPLRIMVPRGAYVPRFERCPEPSRAAALADAAAPARNKAGLTVADGASGRAETRRRWWAAAAASLVSAGCLAALLAGEGRADFGSGLQAGPALAASLRHDRRPLVAVAAAETAGAGPAGFSTELLRGLVLHGLAGAEAVAVVDGSAGQGPGEAGSRRYALNLVVAGPGEAVLVLARLTALPSGRIAWAGRFDVAASSDPGTRPEDDVAQRIASAAIAASAFMEDDAPPPREMRSASSGPGDG